MIRIEGNITGAAEASAALIKAPEVFYKSLLVALFKIRKKFIGEKGGYRGYRLSLLSKRKKSWPGQTWSSQIAGQFKGYIDSRPSEISSLNLRVGVGLNNPKKIHKMLWMMQTGGTLSSSGGYLAVPVIKNLVEAGLTHTAIRGGKTVTDSAAQVLRGSGSKLYATIRVGSKILVIRRDAFLKSGRFQRSGLMYVLQKRVNITKQFTGRYDFYGRWNEFQPTVMSTTREQVDKAVLKVNK